MCVNCDEIIQVGNSGTDGWSPILALYEGECDGDPVTVHQLVSWVDGTGTRPDYDGDIPKPLTFSTKSLVVSFVS